MDHVAAILAGIKSGKSYNDIARKVFLTYPTKAFVGEEDRQFEVLNEIAKFFDVPITAVHAAGSAKTGRSFHQKKDFEPGVSDLDVAIIDGRLYCRYVELVFSVTKGYSNQTSFPIVKGKSSFEEYIRYLARGIFRPDLMPTGPFRAEWNNFFGKLSSKHTVLFASINAAIYLSEAFFESKQRSAIRNCQDEGVL
jgi:hypothetical protein